MTQLLIFFFILFEQTKTNSRHNNPRKSTLESKAKRGTAKIREGNSGTTAVNDKIFSKFREQLLSQ